MEGISGGGDSEGRKRVGTLGPKISHKCFVLFFSPPKKYYALFFTTPQNMRALFRQLTGAH